jgi:hypothetical protein
MKNSVDEFKKVHQNGKVDEYIRNYECVKTRVAASRYTDEEYYLLGFLNGLKDEIAYFVILYKPTNLKEAYKLARQVERSLESHNRMLRPVVKPYFQNSSHFKTIKSREDQSVPVPTALNRSTDPTNPKPLTLDQKKAMGLCFKCGDKFFSGHKCKIKALHLLEGEELSDNDNPSDEEILPAYSRAYSHNYYLCF